MQIPTIITRHRVLVLTSVLSVLVLGLAIWFFFFFNQGLTFSNEQFSFKTPPGWQSDDLKASGLENLAVARFYQDNPLITFHVTTKLISEPANFAELPKELQASFKKEVQKFEELGTGLQKIDDRDALRYEYRYQAIDSDGKEFLSHQEMFIVQVGGSVFYLFGQAADADYEAARPKIFQIIDSFRFK